MRDLRKREDFDKSAGSFREARGVGKQKDLREVQRFWAKRKAYRESARTARFLDTAREAQRFWAKRENHKDFWQSGKIIDKKGSIRMNR